MGLECPENIFLKPPRLRPLETWAVFDSIDFEGHVETANKKLWIVHFHTCPEGSKRLSVITITTSRLQEWKETSEKTASIGRRATPCQNSLRPIVVLDHEENAAPASCYECRPRSSLKPWRTRHDELSGFCWKTTYQTPPVYSVALVSKVKRETTSWVRVHKEMVSSKRQIQFLCGFLQDLFSDSLPRRVEHSSGEWVLLKKPTPKRVTMRQSNLVDTGVGSNKKWWCLSFRDLGMGQYL